ncbi:CDP-2,3-bis-(O-geranylgeranyl)-sn-glycerol synthase [Candidatus Woesearchaeota archaeon]|nr:CDP-2,3-bis-(O-geranylgeranyl)-sn-glycerol synthase [Candidatus Woesearchaeota archaeon]
MAESFAIFLLKCFYLMLPAYFANMAPVIVKKVNLFVFPIDFNKKIKNKPVLGKNKTFRGLIFGIVFAIAIVYFQFLLYNLVFFKNISFFNYENWLLFGFLMGFGALIGDLVKSFFKRRLGFEPGAKFVPFDQTDFVVGALIFIMPIFDLTFKIFITSLLLSFILHIIVNHSAFYLKIRNEKW